MDKITRFTTFIIALVVSLTAKAQFYAPQHQADSTIRVSLLTAAPGAEIYQLEGHTALRLQFNDIDVVANWGLFDFSSPNFAYRFVKGETDYLAGVWSFNKFLHEYRIEGRRVVEQELDLTQPQARKLLAMIEHTVRPENRVYRYNYVLDNCATRPISYIEQATGQTISFPQQAAELSEEETFRSVMKHFHRNYPWYQFGIDLALGSGIDSPISIRQAGFAPVVMEQIAAHATIGDSIKLVKSTTVLNEGLPNGAILEPTPWYLTPITVFCVVAVITLILCVLAYRKKRICKWFTALWFAVSGICGCIITFLVFVSVHEATSPNNLLLWLNPFCFIVPMLIWCKKAQRMLQLYMTVNLGLILLYIMTWIFGSQYANPAFAPIIATDILLSLTYLKLTREHHN